MSKSRAFFKKYWLVFAGFFIIQTLFNQVSTWSLYVTGKVPVVHWGVSIISAVTNYAVWALMVVPLYKLYLLVKPVRGVKAWVKLVAIMLLVASVQGISSQFFYLSSYELFFDFGAPFGEVISDNLKFFLPKMFSGILVVFFLLSMLAALDYYEQYKEEKVRALVLETELSKSKLELLRAQLNPHFLFNALNTISMMIRGQKNSKAIEMISSLSTLLRTSLSMEATQLITLKEEMIVVKQYMEIEEERFKDRLSIIIGVAEEVKTCLVPNMVLQPLVENAFKYGITDNLDEALIYIEAKTVADKLQIKVENSGSSLPQGWNKESDMGIGLNNVDKRLSLLFENYSFNLMNTNGMTGVIAIIEIPKKYPSLECW